MTQVQSNFVYPPPSTHLDSGYFEIVATAAHLPMTQKTTAQLISENGLSLVDKIITQSTGVKSRHIADKNHTDSDVLSFAARKCIEKAGANVNALSKIMVNKLLGDRILPPTSTMMQRKLNIQMAVQTMDIDGGSNGFLQALLTAAHCLDAGDETILIVSGGVHQRLMNPNDSRTAFLYGDASAAVLLRASERRHMLAHYEFSNSQLSQLHHGVDFYHFVPGFLNERKLDLFAVGNLRNAEAFYKEAACHTMHVLLNNAQCRADEVDMFFINQMNLPLWSSIVQHLEIPKEKVISILPTTGNTLAASIPLQMATWQAREKNIDGKKILIISLGEGCLGGGCLYQF
ncbi:MAG: hypothetical protein JXR76_19260 [Deltaproteobacteria bacterium]|nr:hypothetical protein [Deltaproteobacteria bacterium]